MGMFFLNDRNLESPLTEIEITKLKRKTKVKQKIQ